MNVRPQKRLAAKIMKVGLDRVKIHDEKEVSEAITREDVRGLIASGSITKARKRGSCRQLSRIRKTQKKKDRRGGEGRKKGALFSRKNKKEQWMKRVRPLRKLLRELRDGGRIARSDYRKIYSMVNGGNFRNKKHMLYYLREREIIKEKGAADEKK